MLGILSGYVSVLAFLLVGVIFVLVVLWLSKFLHMRPTPEVSEVKGDVYECGEVTEGLTWVKFDLRFYIVALLFLVFSVEVALLYPWAKVFKTLGALAAIEAIIFIVILTVPLAYSWAKDDIKWNKYYEKEPAEESEEQTS